MDGCEHDLDSCHYFPHGRVTGNGIFYTVTMCSPNGRYDRDFAKIPIGLRFLTGIPVGQADSKLNSTENWEPSGTAVRNYFLTGVHCFSGHAVPDGLFLIYS